MGACPRPPPTVTPRKSQRSVENMVVKFVENFGYHSTTSRLPPFFLSDETK